MIIVRLTGGLGNQLFQYATGRAIAKRLNVDLKIDLSEFETYKLHSYSLNHFCITESFASSNEVARFLFQPSKKSPLFNKIDRLLHTFWCKINKLHFFSEPSFTYTESIMEIKDNTYLIGYWQSEKYFIDIKKTLYQDLKLKTPLTETGKEIHKKIELSNSVCVHIRRGDYAKDKETNATHGTCSIQYYKDAITFLKTREKKLVLFFFSDDMNYVKENLIINDLECIYVSHNNADRNYEDLFLMSACKHNIIANSTFSWWGAWLNSNPSKKVIAPRQWFNEANKNTKDLIPQDWIKI